MRTQVQSLASLRGLRSWCCCELWLQTQLGSHVAVAVVQASSYSSDSTLRLGTSICSRCGPKKQKIKGNKFLKSQRIYSLYYCFFYGHTHGTWKFLGQGLNMSHTCGNARSFNPLCPAGDGPPTSTGT